MKRVLLLFLSTLTSLFLVELLLRVSPPPAHDLHQNIRMYADLQVADPATGNLISPPDSKAVLWGHPHRFNSLGMRDEEPRIPKPPGTRRILLLGDSVTFGQGAAQEDIFAYRIRQLLALEAGRGSIDVMAAGIPGWNTVHETRFLQTHLAGISPDVVVLLYVGNDREPENPLILTRKKSEGLADTVWRALVLHSRVVELVAFAYRSHSGSATKTRDLREYAQAKQVIQELGQPFSPDDRGWLKSRQALLQIRDLLKAANCPWVIVSDALGSYAERGLMLERLREFSDETGVPWIDMATYFSGHDGAELRNQDFIDPHPNALGHDLIARGLVGTLRDMDLLSPATP